VEAKHGIGIVGSGFMGRTWAEVTRLGGGTPLRAVAGGRRSEKLAADYGVDHGADVRDLVERADIDLVIITTPPNVHEAQTAAAASAGKHVLVEKPMAYDAGQAAAMVEVCKEAGVHLAVVSQHRFRNSPMAAKRLIDSGAIGVVRMARVTGIESWWDMTLTQDQWKLDPRQQKVFADWGAHGCDVLRWLVGSTPLEVFCQSASYTDSPPPGQSVFAQYRFASGVLASVWMTYEVPPPGFGSAMQFLVTGSEGIIEFDAYGEVRLGDKDGWRTVYSQPAFDPLDPVSAGRLEAYRRELDDVVAAIESGQPPTVSGLEGLVTQQMLDGAEDSAASGLPVMLGQEAR
jgi:UDP-N-acetyl-2-amino-2-deoxyglucuronate dehydrogenase